MAKIEVNDLFKIFGSDNVNEALDLAREGISKKDIQERTGCVVAVADVTFEVKEHEIFVIMGLSGCGKSTLLRCINRLVAPTSGEIRVDDRDICGMSDQELRGFRQENMGMVFQHFGLLPHRTVIGNVEFGMELHGVKQKERRKKAEKAVELVGLEGFENSRVHELSGGMQQRVGLARALAPDAPIILMDEAFSALDPLIRTEMQEEFLRLQKKEPRTILFISHDLDESLLLGDRIAIMKDGFIVRLDEPEEILIDPQDDYVESFVKNVDRSKIISAATVMMDPQDNVSATMSVEKASKIIEEKGAMPVLEEDGRFVGILTLQGLEDSKANSVRDLVRDDAIRAKPGDVLADLLLPSADSDLPIVVVDDNSKFQGWITRRMLLSGIQGNRLIQ